MEFPVELDEFLLCLVDECGTDWELISNEFLEVAASLDPDLQEKAFGVFSPAGLAARYQALTSDQARVETPAIPQVAEPREEPAFQESERIGYSAGEGEIGPEVAPIPSNFSIFNTQNASVLAAYETLKERLPSANIDLDAESGCDSGHEELGNIVDPELTQKTDDIFGTSNLDKIFPPVIDTESTSNVCSMFPSFDATLLSLGVNPNDIEGPLVQVPEEIRPAFDNLRFRMENYDMLDRPEASPQHNQQKTQVIPSMERKPKNVTLYKGIPVQDENEEESQGETSGGDEFLNSRNKMKISSEVALFKAINEGNTMPVKAFNPPPRRPRKPAKTERKAPPPPLPRPSVEKFVVLPLEEASSVSSEDEDEETQDFLGSDAKDLADSSISFPPIPGVVNMENYDLEELEEFKRQTEERRQKLSSRLDEVGLLPRKDELQQAIEKMYVGQAHLYPGQTMSGAKSIPEPEPTPVRIARREPDPLLTKEPEPTIEMLREETAVKEEPEDPLKDYLSAFCPIVHTRITFTPHISSLPIKETQTAAFPWPQTFPQDDTISSLSALLQVAKGAQLCCEKDYIALAFDVDEDLSIFQAHGLQCRPTSVFTQPLAFNAYAWGNWQQDNTITGDTCAIVLKEVTAVRPLLLETYRKGLYLAGMRSLYSTKDNIGISAHSHVIPHRRNLILAFRGPHCYEILQELIGPNCPKLASKTDPASLNATFQTVVASPPMRSQGDISWAFGGRLPLKESYTPPTNALGIFPVQPIAFAMCERLPWKQTLDVIRTYIDFGGTITAINSVEQTHACGAKSVMQVHALREGGIRFSGRLGLPGTVIEAKEHLGLHVRIPPPEKPWAMGHAETLSFAHQWMPEVCIICLSLLPQDKHSFHEVFEHLPYVDSKIFAGRSLEVTSIRVVDVERVRKKSNQSAHNNPLSLSSATCLLPPQFGLTAMACVRGFQAIVRCQGWCERDCRSVAAGASSRLLYVTKTMDAAFDLYHTFFYRHESFPILPQEPRGHMDSIARFHTQLFPSTTEQKAVAFVFPPFIANVSRVLRCLEHNEFSLVAGALQQRLSDEEKAALLEQEMCDRFLFPGEEYAVDGPCVRLVVQRLSAVHKLTELLAHGDPKENERACRFSLRRGDRVDCHVRCTSRLDTASAMTTNIECDQFIIDRGNNGHGVVATTEDSLIALAAGIFEKLDEKAQLLSLSAKKDDPRTSSFFAAFDRPHPNITREATGAHTLEIIG